MEAPKQFEIAIRRRMPFVNSLLFIILMVCSIIFFIFHLIMLPTKYASGEMTLVYYTFVVPEILKVLSGYSILGILILGPVYYSARLHKPAILTIQQDHLSIKGRKIDLSIPFVKIDKVFCNDLHNLFGKPKGKLQFVIQQKKRRRVLATFRLKFYEEGEKVLEALSTLKNVKFAFYEDTMINDHTTE